MKENKEKLLKFASEIMGQEVEYKYMPNGAQESVWDMLERCPPTFDREGNIKRLPIPTSSRSNLAIILENDTRFSHLGYSPQSDQIIYQGRMIEPSDIEDIGIFLERNYRIKTIDKALKTAVLRVAKLKEITPIRDYLTGLPIWDGTPRIAALGDRVYHADYPDKYRELIQNICRCWLISAVARQMDPGCEVHTCFTLISAEKGVGKGLSLKALASEEWYSNSPLEIGTKKGYMQIHQSLVWFWELAEMASLQGKSAEVYKAFVTGAWDRFVPSYAEFPAHRPRRLVLIMSTNNLQFLTDGPERRIHPIKIKKGAKIDVQYLRDNRDQIWAEALHLYNNNVPWHLSRDMETDLAEYQQLFIIDDPWASTVQQAVTGAGPTGISTRDIMEVLQLPASQQHTGNSKRIAQICRDLGYKQINKGGRKWKE